MKKSVDLQDATKLMKLVKGGKRVQGVLYEDEDTGELTYKPYYSRSQHKKKDNIIKVLEHGWVKESVQRIKVYDSIPKMLGNARVVDVLARETDDAIDAIENLIIV